LACEFYTFSRLRTIPFVTLSKFKFYFRASAKNSPDYIVIGPVKITGCGRRAKTAQYNRRLFQLYGFYVDKIDYISYYKWCFIICMQMKASPTLIPFIHSRIYSEMTKPTRFIFDHRADVAIHSLQVSLSAPAALITLFIVSNSLRQII
jgi:hypothetical protein